MRTFAITLIGIGSMIGAAGCAQQPPPVERVPVAAAGDAESRVMPERPQPLPERSGLYDRELPPEPPFYDPPLVNQKTPEQGRFEEGYRAVGRPRITIIVNRTVEGEIVPSPKEDRVVDIDRTIRIRGAVDDRQTTKVYLKHGEYDEAQARALDYQAVENVLTDFLACQGAVEIMSPTMARQKLTDDQIKDLQSGKPRVLREIAQQLDTDILIQISAHPTRQTQYGLEIRLVGEALNVRGGQQIGRAVVDIPPPLDKVTLNRYTRFVVRKLMMDMTQAWSTAEPPRGAPEKPNTEKVPDPDKK